MDEKHQPAKKFRIIFSKTIQVPTRDIVKTAETLKQTVEKHYKGITIQAIEILTENGWEKIQTNIPACLYDKELTEIADALEKTCGQDIKKIFVADCRIMKSTPKRLVIGITRPESYPQLAAEPIKSQIETISHKKIQFAFIKPDII